MIFTTFSLPSEAVRDKKAKSLKRKNATKKVLKNISLIIALKCLVTEISGQERLGKKCSRKTAADI